MKKKRYFFVDLINWTQEGQCVSVELIELSNRRKNVLKYSDFEKFMDDGVLDWWIAE